MEPTTATATRPTARRRRKALAPVAAVEISNALTTLLADMFALFLKTKNFYWHVSGLHLRDYHLMLDQQAAEIFSSTDAMAERVRKIGGTTLRSIGHIGRIQRVLDNDAEHVLPFDMLAELAADNRQLAGNMRWTHELCGRHGDMASTSLIEMWIDEAERRRWFLDETTGGAT